MLICTTLAWIHFHCLQTELEATAEEHDQFREQLEELKASLHTANLAIEAKESEKASLEEDLKAMTQDLKSKQEELDLSLVGIWHSPVSE